MEICVYCGQELRNHGSCCQYINVYNRSTGYWLPPGNYRIIAGELFKIVDSTSKNTFSIEHRE